MDAVDQFLSSLGLDPSEVSLEAKNQGGSGLACAALANLGGNSTVITTQADGTANIQQAQAHWYVYPTVRLTDND